MKVNFYKKQQFLKIKFFGLLLRKLGPCYLILSFPFEYEMNSALNEW